MQTIAVVIQTIPTRVLPKTEEASQSRNCGQDILIQRILCYHLKFHARGTTEHGRKQFATSQSVNLFYLFGPHVVLCHSKIQSPGRVRIPINYEGCSFQFTHGSSIS